MLLVQIALIVLAAIGHAILWVALVNRIHSLAIPRWSIKILSASCWASLLLIPLGLARPYAAAPIQILSAGDWPPLVYLASCWLVALVALSLRLGQMAALGNLRTVLISNHTSHVDMLETLGHRPVGNRATAFCSRLPGNQMFHLRIQTKTLRLPRLPRELDGLTIAHLSDLHMSGRIEKTFFEEIVSLTNSFKPDLVAITGDLFDTNRCIDWTADTVGRLEARCGVYFVFGNHDLRIDARRARRVLTEAGLVDLGGCWREIEVAGQPIVLAGNELPWFCPAADMEHCPRGDGPTHRMRVLLSHSPDQIYWARAFDFDLMLAGHTHGGQIRFPILGPVVTPSWMGTRFASGTFYLEPTVMHVSRGVSSLTPLRFNCPPELAILKLESAGGRSSC